MAHANQIRILSVEDHPVFRQGLATVIETEPDMILVSQAANGGEAIAEFRRHRPDITLMDLRLRGANGTDILVTIRGEFPDERIIMLSSSDSDGEIQRALRSGASGYVLKSMPQNQLLAVIRSVHGGKRQVPEWGREIVDNTPWQTIRHICGNMRFVYDGHNAVIGTSVLTVFMVAGEQASPTVPFSVGEDHDRFVRTEQDWRFASRRWVELFARGDALTLT